MENRRINDIKLKTGHAESDLLHEVEKITGMTAPRFRIIRKSLDARDKNDIAWVYSVEVGDCGHEQLPKRHVDPNNVPDKPVVVVGSGPGGLFCAVALTEAGFRPLVVERGDRIENRTKKVDLFAACGKLDEQSNIQFGEGGAGTFSDGKLNTQTHSPYNRRVLELFVRFGAPEEILYLNKPHIGSDRLRSVITAMREFILSHGGSVSFNTCLTDISLSGGSVRSVTLKKDGHESKIEPSVAVLAVGHSARDTFRMLRDTGIAMQQKDFAVGVRIEYLQEKIGYAQYGKAYKDLPAADYKLVSHAGERAAFTFCMCPGGFVMPAASETGGVVTNGMSNYARDGINANSALIVPVTAGDFGESGPLAGVEFQRKLEHAAFVAGGSTYAAPVQTLGAFLSDRMSKSFGAVRPTYPHTEFAMLGRILPSQIVDSLKIAVKDMDRRLHGFADPDAVLTAVESRTSSPVRILRNETLCSVCADNLYPCGEGAGYAGGITSAAADGLKVADAIIDRFLR